ncbi:unnamed protein product [Musa acuminata var. zebrina]
MAEFAPNLDDGEMWLPSEIIADLGLRRLHHSNAAAARVRGAYHHTFDVEGLASQLAALSPLDRVQRLPAAKLPPVLPPHYELQGLKPVGPAARFELEERELGTGLGRPVYGMGFGACSRPGVTRPGPTQAAQAQACGPETVEAFGRAPQRPLRPIQSRLGTVRPGGQGRESGGGTGVFLPRVINNNEARKKHHNATGGEQQKQQPTRSTAMWKLERPFQPTSEMRLPQEWTY